MHQLRILKRSRSESCHSPDLVVRRGTLYFPKTIQSCGLKVHQTFLTTDTASPMASHIEDRPTPASLDRTADGNPLEIYCSTSFVGDLSYQAPASQIAGMAHTLVTGRKTWKTSKGKNEAVWPAHIEAALFDGKINLPLRMPFQ